MEVGGGGGGGREEKSRLLLRQLYFSVAVECSRAVYNPAVALTRGVGVSLSHQKTPSLTPLL